MKKWFKYSVVAVSLTLSHVSAVNAETVEDIVSDTLYIYDKAITSGHVEKTRPDPKLEKQLDKTLDDNSALQRQVDNLNKDLEIVKTQLKKANAKAESLEEQNKAMKADATSHDNQALIEAKQAWETEKLALEEDRAALQEQKDALEQEKLTLQDQKNALEQEKSALKEKKDVLEQEKIALQEQKSALEQDVVALNTDLQALKGEKDALGQQIDAFSDEKVALKAEIVEKTADLSNLQASSENQKKLSESDLNTDLQKSQTEIAVLRQQKDLLLSEKKRLADENERLHIDLQSVNEKLRLSNEAQNKRQVQSAVLSEKAQTQGTEIAELENEIARLRAEKEEVHGRWLADKDRLGVMQRELLDVKTEKNIAIQQFNARSEQNNQALDDEKQQLMANVQTLKAENTQLRQDRDDYARDNADLREAIDGLRMAQTETTDTPVQDDKQVKVLMEQVKAYERDIAKYEIDRKDMGQRVADLQAENSNLQIRINALSQSVSSAADLQPQPVSASLQQDCKTEAVSKEGVQVEALPDTRPPISPRDLKVRDDRIADLMARSEALQARVEEMTQQRDDAVQQADSTNAQNSKDNILKTSFQSDNSNAAESCSADDRLEFVKVQQENQTLRDTIRDMEQAFEQQAEQRQYMGDMAGSDGSCNSNQLMDLNEKLHVLEARNEQLESQCSDG